MGSRTRQLAVVAALVSLGVPATSPADDKVPDPSSAAINQYIEMLPSSTGDQPASVVAQLATTSRAASPQQAPTAPQPAKQDPAAKSASPDKTTEPVQEKQATPGSARVDQPSQTIASAPNPSLADVGGSPELFAFAVLMAGTVVVLIAAVLRRRPR